MNNKDHKKSNFWGGFFMGTVVGGALYSLLSTKEGREKVKEILEKGQDFLTDLEKKGEGKAKEYFDVGKEKMQEKVSEIKEELKEAVTDPDSKPRKSFSSFKKLDAWFWANSNV